ncbi:MAG: M20/M25/M40 family metallo-hydrolase [Gammaproteobacteria bacterium]|nr:M20/M25/M40 family metallo-hydrolase [Gammaproteobacteria bacterium]
MNNEKVKTFIDNLWQEEIVPALVEYIKIPAKSPMFDAKWQEHGYLEQVISSFAKWAKQHAPHNATVEVIRLENRTPLLFMEIPGEVDDTVLLYGHCDKQPEMKGWAEGTGPWTPILKDEKLYGRGGADDGYAMFASLTSILALQQQNIAHARCVILIEACEESGSYDLPFYIDHLKQQIGTPSFIVCLDSGAGNYDQMWSTTSLRGLINGVLTIQMLEHGVHSGLAGGVVPSSFRIARQLLSRIENEMTGEILVKECHVPIPAQRREQANVAAKFLNEAVFNCFPFLPGAQPISTNVAEAILFRTWYPTMEIIGGEGLPSLENAGSVLQPFTKLKISIRVPPTCDAKNAYAAIKKTLEADPPYGAKVNFVVDKNENGWSAPALSPWLEKAANQASETFFGAQTVYMGEGASIPFMGMLGKKFPDAQFLITGVLGPQSNAHGPNEFLHLPTAQKLTCCVAYVLAQHAKLK